MLDLLTPAHCAMVRMDTPSNPREENNSTAASRMAFSPAEGLPAPGFHAYDTMFEFLVQQY
jgi:hypothetical protein